MNEYRDPGMRFLVLFVVVGLGSGTLTSFLGGEFLDGVVASVLVIIALYAIHAWSTRNNKYGHI